MGLSKFLCHLIEELGTFAERGHYVCLFFHGGPRHRHTGLATDRIFSGECHQRFERLDHLERLQVGVHHQFETVLSCLRHLGIIVFIALKRIHF